MEHAEITEGQNTKKGKITNCLQRLRIIPIDMSYSITDIFVFRGKIWPLNDVIQDEKFVGAYHGETLRQYLVIGNNDGAIVGVNRNEDKKQSGDVSGANRSG